MSFRMSGHAVRLIRSFALIIILIPMAATIISIADSSHGSDWLIGTMLFWPTVLLDKFFPPDPDYMDLEIMFASLFISIGSYTLVVYFVLWCLSKIKAEVGELSIDRRA
jgi:hypothetical protein